MQIIYCTKRIKTFSQDVICFQVCSTMAKFALVLNNRGKNCEKIAIS